MSQPPLSGQPAKILTTFSGLVPPGSASESRLFDADRVDWNVDWQTALRRAIRSTNQLRQLLGLPLESDSRDSNEFGTFVPLEFLRRIQKGDARDPLLRQVLVTSDEQLQHSGFVSDPVGDGDALATPGLIHKYDGRVLLIASGACAVHCRYCFRREFPYGEFGGQRQKWEAAIQYVRSHPDVHEVILSGGDPLTLVDENLFELLDRIDAIGHVRRIRIHSRFPIVIPQRITPAFCDHLSSLRSRVWFVIHANHASELDATCLSRIGLLVEAGIPVLNQSVLLRGVNANEQSLVDLMTRLVDHRIQPYYLHQLDRVRGTKHFEVPIQHGLELMRRIRARLPGYAVPTYVTEQPGQPSKTPLDRI
ncbi:EF-P beta-lysylation protein EpmB [Novipirellula artificiosorum]|uniref:L-lysine 2,3-aminomutase n=1 Tax=Novipirellula artificiosorum TaxID=2528016 RepID=A0A5C6DEL2_9BACT|nr:EF-P beta-lysylation protein EpmB [Novipirellula artificiosorum]TWU34257.1 L-lysine 2,3-aminomutase [Novipirellula artificiosorum]